MFEGFNLTLARGYAKIIVNMDAKRMIDAIMHKDNHGFTNLTLIRQICLLMAKHDVVILEHTFRKANSIANDLAKTARVLQNGYHIFEEVLERIKNLLRKDSFGLVTSRIVVV